MKTNSLMLKELLKTYEPKQEMFSTPEEVKLIEETLCIKKMDILALRNLRDYVVVRLCGQGNMKDWDKMSAITHIIDCQIIKLGGEV